VRGWAQIKVLIVLHRLSVAGMGRGCIVRLLCRSIDISSIAVTSERTVFVHFRKLPVARALDRGVLDAVASLGQLESHHGKAGHTGPVGSAGFSVGPAPAMELSLKLDENPIIDELDIGRPLISPGCMCRGRR